MRNYKLGAILGCLWLSCDVDAAITNPAGIWQLSGKPKVTLTFGGKTYKLPLKSKLTSTVQFQDGNSYTLITAPPNAWPQVHGQWQFKAKPKTYTVSYPLSEFNLQAVAGGQALTPFMIPYINNVLSVVQQALKQNITVSDLRLKSYRDRGKLTRNGALAGTQRMQVLATYLNPNTKKNETTKIRGTIAYTAIQMGAGSSCCTSDDPSKNLQDGQVFLAANKTLPGIQTTASGLQYAVITPGTGTKPTDFDFVTIAYRGTLPNGQVFDSSTSYGPAWVGGFISGFTEGLKLMPVGGYYRFYIPPQLAYGAEGNSKIKPNSTLVFDVVLKKIN